MVRAWLEVYFYFMFEVDIEVENEADISWILREWSVMNST